MTWLTSNYQTAIVLMLVVIAVAAAIVILVRDRKKGKPISCGGDCMHCAAVCREREEKPPMRASIATLGCKVNQYESDRIERELVAAGYEMVDFHAPADLVIINSCTVTQMADKKSRQMVQRAKKQSPNAFVVMIGCYAQEHPEIANCDLLLGNREKDHFLAALPERFQISGQHAPAQTRNRTRAFIKVQDGCRQYCSYCIIPYVRGELRSTAPEDTIREVEYYVSRGCTEIVLTGIHLTAYGRKGTFTDPERTDTLGALVKRVSEVPGVRRIRLGSLEPGIVTDAFLADLQTAQSFCPQFHLSLQSGSDTILKKMNRHYTTAEYQAGVEKIMKAFPTASVTTDLIVGFPEESENDFQSSLDFIRTVGFARTHVFKYSRRKGTAADARPNQVPENVKNERSETALDVAKQTAQRYMQAHLGQIQSVLIEEHNEGYTASYIRVHVDGDPISTGEIVDVRLTGIQAYSEEIGMKGERI